MKKLFTMLFALAAISVSAQFSKNDFTEHVKQVSKESLPIRHNPINPSRATTNIAIDYDSFDHRWQLQNTPPDSMYYFSWSINKNNPNDSIFTLDYAILTMDTLIDVNNNFAGTPKAGTTVRVDSFDLIVAHDNKSGLNDTLIVSVFDKNTATVTGTGASGAINTTPLWADTIILNADFFPTDSLFYLLSYTPNVTLPVGHVAGIRVDFSGPVSDQLYVIGSYRDRCSRVDYGDTNKIAPRNSSFYWNYPNLSSVGNFTTNLTLPGSTTNCRYFLLQNFLFYPYLTLNTPSGGSCTVDPNTTQGITPTSDNVPCINQGQSFSQTYTFVVPSTVGGFATVNSMTIDSIGNLPAGLNYSFDQNPPTYAGGAKGCILVTGTTNAACGQYKVLIYVTAVTSVGTFSNELGALATQFSIPGFSSPFLRVKATAGTCPAVNNSQTANFVADPTCGVAVTISLTTSATNVNCFGGNNGTATVTATGGSNYTYSWNTNPVQTTATATGLAAGTYSVTVTSGTATASATVSVTQPASALTAAASATQSSCSTPTGSATVTPAGGTAGYTVVWNNTQTTTTISNIGAGNYTVTVTDTRGCTATASTQVTTTSGPSATSTTTSVACFGGSTGAVDVTVTGGTGTITYNWNPAASTQDLTNVPAGAYSVTITDANNCSFGLTATVTQPTAALTATSVTTNVACFGGLTGAVTVTVTGGTPNYSYNWGGGITTQNRTAVAAGTYNLTVTDANNCTFNLSASVSQPAAALSVTATATPSSGNNGTATATATGGTTVYAYSWNTTPTQTTATATGLAPGTYAVVVTDANSCTASAAATVVVVGVSEVGNEITNFSLFPNPANEKLNVVMDLENVRSVQLNVIDITGKVIYSAKESANGKVNHEIKVSEFAPGVYFIEAIADKQAIRKTFNVVR